MARIGFIFFFVASLVSRTRAQCVLSVQKPFLVQQFQAVVPTSDGSALDPAYASAVSELLVANIVNNLAAIGVNASCVGDACGLDLCDTQIHVRVVLLAILGNFLNGDLDQHDSLAHLRIDTHTGLLVRVYKSWWTRLMLTDLLLVITVTLLAKRVWDTERT